MHSNFAGDQFECKLPLSSKFLFSHLCNHRMCENCYVKIFDKIQTVNICKICNKQHELKDYKWKPREEDFFINDSKTRNAILKV